jgi:quinolinate synthase
MLVHAKKSHAREFILGTEREMAYRMTKDIPGKAFYTPDGAVCVNMKRITLDKVLASLETLSPAVELEPDIMERARAPLERMVRTGRGE